MKKHLHKLLLLPLFVQLCLTNTALSNYVDQNTNCHNNNCVSNKIIHTDKEISSVVHFSNNKTINCLLLILTFGTTLLLTKQKNNLFLNIKFIYLKEKRRYTIISKNILKKSKKTYYNISIFITIKFNSVYSKLHSPPSLLY